MRGLILGLAVGLAVLLTAGEGRADYLHGQGLNEICSADEYCLEPMPRLYRRRLRRREVLDPASDKRRWYVRLTACVPDGVSAGQLVEVVKKWLREHPENWHYGADSLVAAALQEAFPCR
jgi:hypothetical protein